MKKVFFLILMLGFVLMVQAQEIVIKDICLIENDIKARTDVRLDKTGKECALIRVNVPTIKNMEFDKKVVVDKHYAIGEYCVYVPEGTKHISYSIEGNPKGVIDFEAFDISVHSKNVYRCMMQLKKDGADEIKNTISIETYPKNAIVLLDGKVVGETPLKLMNIAQGTHVLNVPKIDKYEDLYIPDTTIIITGEKHQSLKLQLKKYDIVREDLEDLYDNEPSRYKTVTKNGKNGLAYLTGKEIVPCVYDYVRPEIEAGLCRVMNNNKVGLYQPGKGELIAPEKYDMIGIVYSEGFSGKYFEVEKNINNRKCCGIIDRNGNEIIPCVYKYIEQGRENMFKVKSFDGKWGFLKFQNNTLVRLGGTIFDIVSDFNDGIALVELDGNLAIIDKLGNLINLPSYYKRENWFYSAFNEGLCDVLRDGKLCFIDKNGHEVIPCIFDKYSDCDGFRQGGTVLRGYERPRWLLISKSGDILGDNEKRFTDYVVDFTLSNYGNYFKIERDNKYGVMKRNGNIIVPCEYDKITIIRNGNVGECIGYFSAEKEETCYLLDSIGKVLFEYPSDVTIDAVKDGFIRMYDNEDGPMGYANMKGEIIASCIYGLGDLGDFDNNCIKSINEGLAAVCIGDRYGFIDITGEFIIPLNYINAVPFEDGKAFVQKQDGNWVEIDVKKLKYSKYE